MSKPEIVNDDITKYVDEETVYRCVCGWCGLEEEYNDLVGIKCDGWVVAKDTGIGLWCGKCEIEENEECDE